MAYSFKIIWREPRRYLPAVLAVAFSDVLITVQVGLCSAHCRCSRCRSTTATPKSGWRHPRC